MKRLCVCGHKRSEHRYRYDSLGRSYVYDTPCTKCVIVENLGACVTRTYGCRYYEALNNLEYLQMKYEKNNA